MQMTILEELLNTVIIITVQLKELVILLITMKLCVIETPIVTRDYRTRASMNWVNEDGKWVAKTMHFSAASFGDVTVT